MPPFITRRAVLAAAPVLPLEMTAAPATAGSLAAAAAASGRLYGCAATAESLARDPDFAAAVLRECAAVTPELELKWAAVEPRRGELILAPMDQIAERARRAGKVVHGHTLVWHQSIPTWAEAALRDQRDWSLLERYFASVVPRYGAVISRWDVVNEPIDPHGPGGLRDSPFLRAFGPDYVRRALETARLYAPGAKLMLNDYGLDYEDGDDRLRRKALLQLIDRLKAAGAPLDGVGLQAHLHLGRGRPSQQSLRAFLGELAQRGLFIMITELDVKEADYALSASRRDAAVAGLVRSYLDAVLDQPAVIGVTTWGLSDRYSWLQVTEEDLRRRPDAWRDGSSPGVNRGLPLDSSLRRKPMYEAMRAAFLGARSKSAAGSII